MTRHHTLHASAAGIRLAWPAATTIVIDPGTNERARTRNLARERYLVTGAVLLSAAGLVILQRSQPHDRPWTVAAGLLLGALACAAARPSRRVLPADLVDMLEPLRATVPARLGEIHRLVWEAVDLIEAAKACDGVQPCPDCADRVDQIHARLRVLTRPHPSMPSGLCAPLVCGTSTSAAPRDRGLRPARVAIQGRRAQSAKP